MGEADKKTELESPEVPSMSAVDVTPTKIPEEKADILPSPPGKTVDEFKAPVSAEKETHDSAEKKHTKVSSLDRDVALANVEKEKTMSYIKAWEESEKTKADNKWQKKFSAVASWENSRKATLEAKLKQVEEQLEKKKAEYAEKMKNKVALIHKEAEEKRAMVESQRGQEKLKAEETSAKYRATGQAPKMRFGCF